MKNMIKTIHKITLVSALLTSAAQASILIYTFENGTAGNLINTAVDTSGNSLNGVATEGEYSTDTPTGGGFLSGDFTGDLNFITTSNDVLLQPQEFTLSLDFKPNSPNSPGGETPSTLVTKKIAEWGSFISNYRINFDPGSGDVTAQLSWSAGNGVLLTGSNAAPLGDWTSVAFVLDRDISGADDFLGLYVNGSLVDSLTQEIPTLNYSTNDLVIGAGNFNTNGTSTGSNDRFRRNFDGWIDNVSLSSTPIPEPSSVWLISLSAFALAFSRHRRSER